MRILPLVLLFAGFSGGTGFVSPVARQGLALIGGFRSTGCESGVCIAPARFQARNSMRPPATGGLLGLHASTDASENEHNSILWRDKLSFPRPALWTDITDEVDAAVPALSSGLCHVRASPGMSLVLIDPRYLELASPKAVAPNRKPEISLFLLSNKLVYPSGTRLVLIREGDEQLGSSDSDVAEVELRLEASEEMLRSSPLSPSPAFALSQAALRIALEIRGVEDAAIRRMEQADEATPAFKVYESFLIAASSPVDPSAPKTAGAAGAAMRPETLMPAAQRAAHHIAHLLREEQAALAVGFLRNA
ncbi:hypothetical protein T484DRAFT_1765078, partial [Baffinella frigidus]